MVLAPRLIERFLVVMYDDDVLMEDTKCEEKVDNDLSNGNENKCDLPPSDDSDDNEVIERSFKRCFTFHTCCVAIILRVYEWVKFVHDEGRLRRGYGTSVVKRAAAMVGISERSLYNLRTETRDRLGPGEKGTRRRNGAIPEDSILEIRPAINRLIVDEKPLTLDSVLKQLKLNNPNWIWQRDALRSALISIGITFRPTIDYAYERLKEDKTNCHRRAMYLKFFFMYVDEKRIINYFDETWFNKNMQESH